MSPHTTVLTTAPPEHKGHPRKGYPSARRLPSLSALTAAPQDAKGYQSAHQGMGDTKPPDA